MNKKEILLIGVLILLVVSIYAQELEPGKLWINGVFIPFIEKCEDGTLINTCSQQKPFHCERHTFGLALRTACNICGCPEGKICTVYPMYDCVEGIDLDTYIIKTTVNDLEVVHGSQIPVAVDNGVLTNVDHFAEPISIGILPKQNIINEELSLSLEKNGISFFTGDINNSYNSFTIQSNDLVIGIYDLNLYYYDASNERKRYTFAKIKIKEKENSQCETILDNGNPKNKLDITFIGKGYNNFFEFRELAFKAIDLNGDKLCSQTIRKGEDEEIIHFETLCRGLFTVEPFKSNKDRINVHLVKNINNDLCKTYINPNDITKEDLICKNKEVIKSAISYCPTDEFVLLSSDNFISYSDADFEGGNVLSYAKVSANLDRNENIIPSPYSSTFREKEVGVVTTHEIGHSLAGLHDELVKYNEINDNEPLGANCDINSECVKWKDLIGQDNIGCFEGCMYLNWYRPTKDDRDSLMYSITDSSGEPLPGQEFNLVSRRRIQEILDRYSVEEKITCKSGQLIGDVNGDGKITPADASMILQIVKGFYKLEDIRCADVNCDNRITEDDAQLILDYNIGKIDRFPCEEKVYDASISIATLKDSYKVGEKIELTDPPDEAVESNLITGNVVNENDENDFGQNIIYERLQIEEKLKKEIEEGIIPETIDISLLPKYVKGELIIKLKKDISNKITGSAIKTDIKSVDTLNRKYNVEKIENVFKVKKEGFFESIGNTAKELVGINVPKRELKKVYKLEISEDVDVEEAVKDYKKDPKVEYAEPNYISYTSFVPNDARYSEQWAHQNTQAEQGWDIERGNSNVVIAIVDTGVDYTHEDLAANIWQNSDEIPDNGIDDDNNGFIDDIRGYDFVNINIEECENDPDCQLVEGEDYTEIDNDPMDFNSHGTHVAGIAAAVTDNNLGIAGVCHNCKIMPVRAGFSIKINFFGNWYEVGSLEDDDIANAIHYAADNNANVISMSFGGGYSNVMKEAIDYAYSKGVVLIAAAGNSNTNLKWFSYPAGYDNVVAVSATDQNDEKADFSNYGYWTDVAAPGVDILSTVPLYTDYNSELKINENIIRSNVFEYSATTSEQGITGELVYVNLGKTKDLTMDLKGKIALIKRGEISFKEKVQNIHNKGAIGAIIYNNEYGNLKGTLQEQANIPVVSISKEDGENLIYKLNNEIVTANLKVWTEILKYASYSGTSMATPYVSGLAGLILSKKDYNQEEVKQILKQSVDTVNSNVYIGTGRVNVKKALEFEPVDAVAEISYPSNDGIIVNNIDIIGTATGDSYTVYYGEGIYPENWIEIGSGTIKKESILVNWNIENINGKYTIKLTVFKNNEYINDFVGIIIRFDKNIKKGWPKKFSEIICDGWCVYPSTGLTLADINKDNNKEIIVGSKNKIYIFNYEGELLEGWEPRIIDDNWLRGYISSADLDNDGFLEILAVDYEGYIHVFDYKGNYLFDPVFLGVFLSTPVIGDLNGDGRKEIVILSKNWIHPLAIEMYRTLHILDSTGVKIVSLNKTLDSLPSIADLDNDGKEEVIFYSEGFVFALDINGSIKEGWPFSHEYLRFKDSGYRLINTPVTIGDLDNDGFKEVVLLDIVDDSIFLINYDGSLKNIKSINGYNSKGYIRISPVLADINKDGYLEILVSDRGIYDERYAKIYLLDHKGDLLCSVEQSKAISLEGIVVTNTNEDEFPEFITAMGDYTGVTIEPELNVYDNNCKLLKTFYTNNRIGSLGAMDIDNDGNAELIVADVENIYVFNLGDNSINSEIYWPMFQHDPQHTGNYHFVKEQLIQRPQSKIVNNEDFDIEGYLFIRIEKKVINEDGTEIWGLYKNVISDYKSKKYDKPRIISANGLIKLDKEFNQENIIINEHGEYRVIAEFKDKKFDIIKTKDGELKAIWNFTVVEEVVQPIPIETCIDSDNGINFNEKGTTTITFDGSSLSQIDFCAIGDENKNREIVQRCAGEACYINEWYCKGNNIGPLQRKNCNCNDGACMG